MKNRAMKHWMMNNWMMGAAVAMLAMVAGAARAAVVAASTPAPTMVMAEAQPEGGQAAAKDDLFAGTEIFEKGASDVSEVSMDPDTLEMVGGKDKPKARNMILNIVRSYEYDKPGMYNMADVDRFRQKLNTGDWHCSIHTRDMKRGESTDICQKRRSDGLNEQVIITVEPKQLTFIHTIMKGGAGSSELGGMMFGPARSLGTLAMLNPAQMAEMNAAMARMQAMGPEMSARMAKMNAEMAERMKDFNSPEMQKKLGELNSPEFREKWQAEKEKAEKEKAEKEFSKAKDKANKSGDDVQ